MRFWGEAHPSRALKIKMTIGEVETYYKKLKLDFKYYSRLQVQLNQEHRLDKTYLPSKASINKFNAIYDATSVEECLHHMVVLNAFLFSTIMDKTGPESDALRKKLLNLEASLLAPKFAHKRDYLDKHAYFMEDVQTLIKDKKLSLSLATTDILSGVQKLNEVKIQFRERKHTNPFRHGDYIDISFNFGIDPVANASIIKSIAKHLNSSALGIAGEFVKVTSMYHAGSHTVRFYRPTAFPGLPYRILFVRTNIVKEQKIAVKIPIPVMAAAHLNVGVNYSTSSTNNICEECSPNTIIYYAMRYMHDCFESKISATGEIAEDSFWNTLVYEQRNSLKKLFNNFSTIPAPGESIEQHRQIKNGLVKELVEIEKLFVNSEEDEHKFTALRDNFFATANTHNFDACLVSFQNLLLGYSTHWKKLRLESALFKPREFKLNLNTLPDLPEWKAGAELSSAFTVMPTIDLTQRPII